MKNQLRNMEPVDFIPYFEELAGQWNGDNSGNLEDQTHICNEIIEKLEELRNLFLHNTPTPTPEMPGFEGTLESLNNL